MTQGIFGVGENFFEAQDSPFNLFSKPTFNNDYYSFNDYTFKPKNPIQNSEVNPIFFEIEDTRNYTLLSTIRVDGQIRVLHADGTSLKAGEKVSTVNLFPHSLFQTIDIKINQVPVSDHARLYPHRAYAHALYSFTHETKKNTQLSEFYLEEECESEKTDDTTDQFAEKMKLIEGSRVCHISFEPKIDTLTMMRYFPPGHTISFEFIRSAPHFTLLSKDNTESYKIEIVDLTLTCRQILPNDAIESKMKKLLALKDIHLPVTRLVSRTRGLHAGLYDGTIYNAICGKMPSHLMIFFLKNSQLPSSANLSSNPFYFSHQSLAEASLVINGQTFPSEKIYFNPTSGDYFKAYKFFLQNIGCTGDLSVGITPQRYMKDAFCLAFDLTPGKIMSHFLKVIFFILRFMLKQPSSLPSRCECGYKDTFF